MSKNLTRQEIKRDELREALARGVVFLHERRMLVLGVAATLLLAVLAVGLFLVWQERQERRAQERLGEALRAYGADIDVFDPDPEAEEPRFASEAERLEAAKAKFEVLLEEHGSTAAGWVARVVLGDIAAQEGDLERARDLWGRFLERSPDHALAASVELNLLSLDRAEGRHEEVVAKLRSRLEDEEDHALPDDVVLFELGRTLEQLGRDEEAQESFQRLVDDFPRSPYTPQAQRRLRDRVS